MTDLQIWRKTTPTLISILRHGLKSGQYSDIEFLVGPEKFSIHAHKTILMLRSELFETMFSEHWTQGQGGTLELVDNHPETFEIFLEFLYTDILRDEETLSLDTLLEVMSLGTMYQIPLLVKQVAKLILASRITAENAIKIYEYAKYLDRDFALEAMRVAKENIVELFAKENHLTGHDTPWNWETWQELLSTDGYRIKEIELFQALVRWSQLDSGQEKFATLVQFIRFPLMGCETFKKHVVSADLLPKEDIINMFIFFTNDTHEHQGLKYPFRSRLITHVSDSAQLCEALQNACDGDMIQLEDGIYCEPFTLANNFLTIRGSSGSIVVATDPLKISGNNCTLTGIHFEGGMNPVLVSGSGNILQNLKFTFPEQVLMIQGDLNIVKNTKLSGLHGQSTGIEITGNRNTIEGLESFDTDSVCIILVSGNQSKLRNINYISTPCSDIDNRVGIILRSGSGHVVEGFTSEDEYNGDTFLQIEQETERVTVNRVKSGMEVLVGGKGHELANIEAKNKIEVQGFKHRLEKCVTELWDVGKVGQHQFVGCEGLQLE